MTTPSSALAIGKRYGTSPSRKASKRGKHCLTSTSATIRAICNDEGYSYHVHDSVCLRSMGLCIVGGDSLDEMEARYVLPYFAGVENKRVSMQQWVEHPYTREQLGWRLHVVPVKDLRTVHISFPLGDERPHYRSQPAHYISHLLGHEGQGSLLSELKRRGWVSQLQAGANKAARGFGFFNVDLDLSEGARLTFNDKQTFDKLCFHRGTESC